jgi:cell division control protein 45
MLNADLTLIFFSLLLRLAIIGLSAQYLGERISHRDYLTIAQTYKDESERLARAGSSADEQGGGGRINNVEDGAIRCTEEYRFMMVRHWSLYESMYNSNYVASRLGIWREPGRQRLLALLAKMGYVFVMDMMRLLLWTFLLFKHRGLIVKGILPFV